MRSGRAQKIFDNVIKGLTGGASGAILYDTSNRILREINEEVINEEELSFRTVPTER